MTQIFSFSFSLASYQRIFFWFCFCFRHFMFVDGNLVECSFSSPLYVPCFRFSDCFFGVHSDEKIYQSFVFFSCCTVYYGRAFTETCPRYNSTSRTLNMLEMCKWYAHKETSTHTHYTQQDHCSVRQQPDVKCLYVFSFILLLFSPSFRQLFFSSLVPFFFQCSVVIVNFLRTAIAV